MFIWSSFPIWFDTLKNTVMNCKWWCALLFRANDSVLAFGGGGRWVVNGDFPIAGRSGLSHTLSYFYRFTHLQNMSRVWWSAGWINRWSISDSENSEPSSLSICSPLLPSWFKCFNTQFPQTRFPIQVSWIVKFCDCDKLYPVDLPDWNQAMHTEKKMLHPFSIYSTVLLTRVLGVLNHF